MIIATLNESSREPRVGITPTAVKKYIDLGVEVDCETNCGIKSGFINKLYENNGANIKDKKTILKTADAIIFVNEPTLKDLKGIKKNTLVVGPIDPNPDSDLIKCCMDKNITVFSMNNIPRITRAQNLDSLSSQANLAGYRAVLEASVHFNRAIPMMMTAAGMIHPAKVLVLGAGVAGLQAIATAKRLGAVVQAFDVRSVAKEQVESLGAEFIEVSDENAETDSGYAAETSEEYKRLQAELIDQHAKLADIVITTALIPNKPAPLLLKKNTVENMKPGSVIIDLATSRGGNCEVSKRDEIIKYNEITIVGYSNMAGLVPATASELYTNNVFNLMRLLLKNPDQITYDETNEIIQQGIICHEGKYKPFLLVEETSHA